MRNKTSGFFSEFKKFALRGNVIDLAVGVIIGGAFSGITSSLVGDIIMPLVGLLIGADTFSTLSLQIGSAQLNIGLFIQTVINFFVLALVIFCLVSAINRLKRKEEAAPAEPPAPAEDLLLLREIRDLLKENN